MDSIKKPCPVCLGETQHYSAHPQAELRICPACSHCFSDLDTIVQEPYRDDYYETTHRNWFQNPNFALFERIRKIAEGVGSDCRLFDVGCGRGDLLKYIRPKNPGFSLTGLELSELKQEDGIRFFKSDIYDFELEEQFDVVTTLAVIEHVPDIRKFVARLMGFVRPGGLLVTMTIDSGSTVYRVGRALKGVGWPDAFNRLYSHHHLHHYTRRSLKVLLEQAGLTVTEHFSHNFPLAAVDFPSKGKIADAVQLAGVATCFAVGNALDLGFLQTIVCQVPADDPKGRI